MQERRILCDICGIKFAEHTCKLCGRRVCSDHFDRAAGICTACKRGRSAHAKRARPQ